ncbi:MAG: nucleoside-diphosphate kinase [Planctomycetota bacterium]
MQRTFVLIKPDAVRRRLVGPIISRFDQKGLALVAMKTLVVTPELSKQHYAEHVDKPFYPELEQFIGSGMAVAMCLEGPEAVSVVRTMLGATNGRESAPGTIRGDFGLSKQMNLVHGSDGEDAADRELAIYFTDDELIGATPVESLGTNYAAFEAEA